MQKIPNGYKIIGIRAHRTTNQDMCLHVNDFLIWKPPPHWLSFAQLAKKFKHERIKRALKHPENIPAKRKSKFLTKNQGAKNFLDHVRR